MSRTRVDPTSSYFPNHSHIPAMVFFFAVGVAALGFRNFPFTTILGSLILYCFIPAVMIVRLVQKPLQGVAPQRQPTHWLGATIAAVTVVISQWSALKHWGNYATNFAHERASASGGFHPDTAFHVALIKGILRTGLPTTGQHLDTPTPYHALTHYFDAIASVVLQLDPWEAYALIFFCKQTSISLAIFYLVRRTTNGLGQRNIGLLFFVVFATIVGDWHVVGSHGQWLPTLILIIIAPWTFETVANGAPGVKGYTLLLSAISVLSVGKISIGFTYAVMVGAALLLSTAPKLHLLYFTLASTLFFSVSSRIFSRAAVPEETLFGRVLDRLTYSVSHIVATSILAIAVYIFGPSLNNKGLRKLACSIVITLLVVGSISVVVTHNSSDSYYFFSAVFTVGFLIAFTGTIEAIRLPDLNLGFGGKQIGDGVVIPLLAGLVFAVGSPVIAQAPLSVFSDLGEIESSLPSLITDTYVWYNSTVRSEESEVTLVDLLRQEGPDYDPTLFSYSLVNEVGDQASAHQTARDPVLFLTSQQLDQLAVKFGVASWSVGLGLSAMTGLPLIYGVQGSSGFETIYGNAFYPSEALRLSESEATEQALCAFNRPVLSIKSLEPLNVESLCLARSGL